MSEQGQKAITVRPIMGPMPSLDLDELNQLLSQGWKFNSAFPAYNDATLVILDSPIPAQEVQQ